MKSQPSGSGYQGFCDYCTLAIVLESVMIRGGYLRKLCDVICGRPLSDGETIVEIHSKIFIFLS